MDIKKNRVYVHTRPCQYSLSPQLKLPPSITKINQIYKTIEFLDYSGCYLLFESKSNNKY